MTNKALSGAVIIFEIIAAMAFIATIILYPLAIATGWWVGMFQFETTVIALLVYISYVGVSFND